MSGDSNTPTEPQNAVEWMLVLKDERDRVALLEETLDELRPLIGSCTCTHPAYGLCGPCQAHELIRRVLPDDE